MKNFIKAEQLRRKKAVEDAQNENYKLVAKARSEGYDAGNRVTDDMREFLANPIMQHLVIEVGDRFVSTLKKKLDDLPGSVVHRVENEVKSVWEEFSLGVGPLSLIVSEHDMLMGRNSLR